MTGDPLTVGEYRRAVTRWRQVQKVCALSAGALLVVSSSYNLREVPPPSLSYDFAFPLTTFMIPPVTLAIAVWLAHTFDTKGLKAGAVLAAVLCFGVSSFHIYHGASDDGAEWVQALLTPVFVDGLALLLTIGYLDAGKRARAAVTAAAELDTVAGVAEQQQRQPEQVAVVTAEEPAPLPDPVPSPGQVTVPAVAAVETTTGADGPIDGTGWPDDRKIAWGADQRLMDPPMPYSQIQAVIGWSYGKTHRHLTDEIARRDTQPVLETV